MGNDTGFEALRLNFLSFLWKELLNRLFRDVFNFFYGLVHMSEGKGIQWKKKKRKNYL